MLLFNRISLWMISQMSCYLLVRHFEFKPSSSCYYSIGLYSSTSQAPNA